MKLNNQLKPIVLENIVPELQNTVIFLQWSPSIPQCKRMKPASHAKPCCADLNGSQRRTTGFVMIQRLPKNNITVLLIKLNDKPYLN